MVSSSGPQSLLLLTVGMLASIAYLLLTEWTWSQWVFVLSFPLFVRNGLAVSRLTNPRELDPYLKQMALSTLLFVLLFGIGFWVG